MMKTKLLYLEEFTRLEAPAVVTEIVRENDRDAVVLDQTIFYPQGGGQPYDTGVIESSGGKFLVEEVRLAPTPNAAALDVGVKHMGVFEFGSFAAGDTVKLFVDADRRMLNARIHSAGHLVDKAVAELDLPWRPGKGYHFPQGPYDEYEGSLAGTDKDKLKSDLERLCNKYVAEGGKTEIIFMTREEMQKTCRYTPDFPIEKGERARVVAHAGFPMPCGGTPVADLADIGQITIRKIKQEKDKIRIGYDVRQEG